MDTLTIEHPAAQLHSQLCQAQADEAAAQQALGAAVLEAMSGGRNVPGKLNEALEAARTRRVQIEAALVAADRQHSAQGKAAQEVARAQRIEQITALMGELRDAAADVSLALAAFHQTQAAPRAWNAYRRLVQATSSMHASSLTAQGHLVCEGVAGLRNLRESGINDPAGEAFDQAMRGEQPTQLQTFIDQISAKLMADLKNQPADWPRV